MHHNLFVERIRAYYLVVPFVIYLYLFIVYIVSLFVKFVVIVFDLKTDLWKIVQMFCLMLNDYVNVMTLLKFQKWLSSVFFLKRARYTPCLNLDTLWMTPKFYP